MDSDNCSGGSYESTHVSSKETDTHAGEHLFVQMPEPWRHSHCYSPRRIALQTVSLLAIVCDVLQCWYLPRSRLAQSNTHHHDNSIY